VMTDAVTTLEGLGASPELVEAMALDAAMSALLGDLGRAIGSANRAISLAAELGLPASATAIGQRGAARSSLGDRDGVRDLTDALDLAKVQGLGQDVAILYNDLSEFLGHFEGPRARVERAREGVDFARRRGIEDLALWLSYNALDGLVDAGSYDEAETAAVELIPRLRDAEDVYLLAFAMGTRMRLLTRRCQDIDEATLQECVVSALQCAPADVLPDLVAIGAAARLSLGDRAGALSLLSKLEGPGTHRGMPSYAANLPDLVRTALASGDVHLAARLADGLPAKHPLHEPAGLTAHGLLAEERGDLEAAAEMMGAAAELWQRFDRPWERAQSLLGSGRCLTALGRTAEAARHLRQARDIFVGLDARPALKETEELLQPRSST